MPETLPAAARAELESLQLWSQFQHIGFPLHRSTLSAWGSSALTEQHAILNPLGPGWYLDRSIFDEFLWHAAIEEHTIPLMAARVCHTARRRGRWRLMIDAGGGGIEARLVVDATGRSSAFARRIGIPRYSIDAQVCVSARCAPHRACGSEALIEAAPEGWWFSAPTRQGDLAVAYFTDADLLRRAYRAPVGLHTLLRVADYTNARVRALILGSIQTRLASSSRLQRCAGDGWYAVGDAALAWDPLASQGVLRALESAVCVARVIPEYRDYTLDSSEQYVAFQMDILERYLHERHFFYGMEKRWPASVFWQRRAGMPTPVIPHMQSLRTGR
jgi:flavin-dependent dehydrogenase